MKRVTAQIDGVELARMSKDRYLQLAEQDFFGDERVEFIFGLVFRMPRTSGQHQETVQRIERIFTRELEERADVFCQTTFDATDDSLPIPDLYISKPREDWFEQPTTAQLVVEVTSGPATHDRTIKANLYACACVDEYWVVDQSRRTLVAHRNRADIGWREVHTFEAGQQVSPIAFPDVIISVDDIFPSSH